MVYTALFCVQEADREEEEVELWRRVRAQAGLTGGWSPVDRPVTTLYTKIAVDRREMTH